MGDGAVSGIDSFFSDSVGLNFIRSYDSALLVLNQTPPCCDDRRSPWWTSRDGLQHDHIRSDTVMIRMNFNNYASLIIFFNIFIFQITGGLSSSCEVIILRSNSHSRIIRVCMAIFTTALRNEKIPQILNKNTSRYFHSVSLVIWPHTSMKRTHFSELSISKSPSHSWSLCRVCINKRFSFN